MEEKNQSMFYMETGSVDPAYNLAFEQFILENCFEGNYVILWQNDNTIVIGRNQNAEEEINRTFVESHGITVIRRMTGGGAVYHDLGNLNYSFITDYDETTTMETFNAPVCRALKNLGLNAESSGRNDILIDGKKVSGVAQRIYKNRILHHGCILFEANMDIVSKALNADPYKFKSKSVKSVSSRVANINDMLDKKITLNEFKSIIKNELLAGSAGEINLPESSLNIVREIADTKYRSWEWNYGHSPEYSFQSRKRFPQGTLDARFNVKNGMIEDAVFYGDFMAQKDNTEAVNALLGVRFERDAVQHVLEKIEDIEKMFGGISAENIADVIS